MLISDIIAAARQYTQITGSTWFSGVDEFRSVNRAYRDIYEKILDSNDEFFIKEITIPVSSLTLVRDRIYSYQLPADWHRLRKLAAVIPTGERQFERLDVQDIQRHEGYRYFGDTIRITFDGPYTDLRMEYYPTPTVFTNVAESVVYPPQLEPLIIAYQIAMDITKAQNGDATKHAEEYQRLWARFEHASARRDNFKYSRVANVYRSTYPGW